MKQPNAKAPPTESFMVVTKTTLTCGQHPNIPHVWESSNLPPADHARCMCGKSTWREDVERRKTLFTEVDAWKIAKSVIDFDEGWEDSSPHTLNDFWNGKNPLLPISFQTDTFPFDEYEERVAALVFAWHSPIIVSKDRKYGFQYRFSFNEHRWNVRISKEMKLISIECK